jgi:hypothetical protein
VVGSRRKLSGEMIQTLFWGGGGAEHHFVRMFHVFLLIFLVEVE